jgi:hypothetical protein
LEEKNDCDQSHRWATELVEVPGLVEVAERRISGCLPDFQPAGIVKMFHVKHHR